MLLDFGTEEQKQRHIPAILKGEEIWMQFLSEPSGGSDVAGALTTAVRDGDEWILNGSKVWTTGAWWSDWGLCLARTNWDVPKHRGLTVFMLPIHQAGIEVHRIEMLNGIEGVLPGVPHRRPGARHRPHRRGRRRLDGRHPLDVPRADALQLAVRHRPGRHAPHGGVGATSVLDVARDAGRLDDPLARDLIGEARMLDLVGDALEQRGRPRASPTGDAVRPGVGHRPARSRASPRARRTTIAFELAGAAGAAWTDDDGAAGRRAATTS